MRLIRWTPEASAQLQAVVKGFLNVEPDAARGVGQPVIDRVEQLADFPGIGRPGEVEGTWELVSPPCVVVYRSTEKIVEILQIWYGAQDWR